MDIIGTRIEAVMLKRWLKKHKQISLEWLVQYFSHWIMELLRFYSSARVRFAFHTFKCQLPQFGAGMWFEKE